MRRAFYSFLLFLYHREIFTTYLTSECQNFQNLDDKCKLIWILNNEDPTILRYLCQYLLSATIWLNGIGDLQTGWPALSMRKKIFLLASSVDALCWLSKSSDPFPCSKQYYLFVCLSPFLPCRNSISTWPVCSRHK